jgi:hypothetical protein
MILIIDAMGTFPNVTSVPFVTQNNKPYNLKACCFFYVGAGLVSANAITLITLVITILFSYDEKLKCSNNKGFLLATI